MKCFYLFIMLSPPFILKGGNCVISSLKGDTVSLLKRRRQTLEFESINDLLQH